MPSASSACEAGSRCDRSTHWGKINSDRAIAYLKKVARFHPQWKHVGKAACNAGGCWDFQSPPVGCNVKKATSLHKICLTHSKKKGKAWVKDTRSEKLVKQHQARLVLRWGSVLVSSDAEATKAIQQGWHR